MPMRGHFIGSVSRRALAIALDPFLVALYPILDDRYPQPPGLADPAGR